MQDALQPVNAAVQQSFNSLAGFLASQPDLRFRIPSGRGASSWLLNTYLDKVLPCLVPPAVCEQSLLTLYCQPLAAQTATKCLQCKLLLRASHPSRQQELRQHQLSPAAVCCILQWLCLSAFSSGG